MIKLAVPYKRFGKLNKQAAEFNIKYDTNKSNYSKLLDFCDMHQDKRINIEYGLNVDISSVKGLVRTFDNVYFRLYDVNVTSIEDFISVGAKFFFNRSVSAYNLASLNSLIQLGVTDIYLADDLWYDLDNISSTCHSDGVQIRAVFDLVPSTVMRLSADPRVMFIRPEDTDILDGKVDVCEFSKDGDEQEEILYRVFFKDKEWHGYVNEYNNNVSMSVRNDTLLSDYSAYKYNCKMRCVTGSPCNRCEQYKRLADTLVEKNLKMVD